MIGKFFLFLLVTIPFLTNCNKDNNGNSNNTTYQNLIQNPSFEDSTGQQSLEGWIISDSALTSFFQNTPPNGGGWSLELEAGSTQGPTALEGFAETYITGQTGTNIYQLTVWMKSLTDWPGGISFGVLSQNQLLQKKEIIDTATTWTQYALIDTLITQVNDTILIHLSAGSLGPFGSQNSILFDLIVFKIITQ